jgi:hypothetical protein
MKARNRKDVSTISRLISKQEGQEMIKSITPISRREVLIGGAAAVAVAGFPLLAVAGQSKPASAFAPRRGSSASSTPLQMKGAAMPT